MTVQNPKLNEAQLEDRVLGRMASRVCVFVKITEHFVFFTNAINKHMSALVLTGHL